MERIALYRRRDFAGNGLHFATLFVIAKRDGRPHPGAGGRDLRVDEGCHLLPKSDGSSMTISR